MSSTIKKEYESNSITSPGYSRSVTLPDHRLTPCPFPPWGPDTERVERPRQQSRVMDRILPDYSHHSLCVCKARKVLVRPCPVCDTTLATTLADSVGPLLGTIGSLGAVVERRRAGTSYHSGPVPGHRDWGLSPVPRAF